jgi:hypothetical protein
MSMRFGEKSSPGNRRYGYKRCVKCERTFHRSQFHDCENGNDGLVGTIYCHSCNRRQRAAQREMGKQHKRFEPVLTPEKFEALIRSRNGERPKP